MFYLMKLCNVQGIVAFRQLFQIQNVIILCQILVRMQTECEAEFHTAVDHEIYSNFIMNIFRTGACVDIKCHKLSGLRCWGYNFGLLLDV